jgi:hypothetical protein
VKNMGSRTLIGCGDLNFYSGSRELNCQRNCESVTAMQKRKPGPNPKKSRRTSCAKRNIKMHAAPRVVSDAAGGRVMQRAGG